MSAEASRGKLFTETNTTQLITAKYTDFYHHLNYLVSAGLLHSQRALALSNYRRQREASGKKGLLINSTTPQSVGMEYKGQAFEDDEVGITTQGYAGAQGIYFDQEMNRGEERLITAGTLFTFAAHPLPEPNFRGNPNLLVPETYFTSLAFSSSYRPSFLKDAHMLDEMRAKFMDERGASLKKLGDEHELLAFLTRFQMDYTRSLRPEEKLDLFTAVYNTKTAISTLQTIRDGSKDVMSLQCTYTVLASSKEDPNKVRLTRIPESVLEKIRRSSAA